MTNCETANPNEDKIMKYEELHLLFREMAACNSAMNPLPATLYFHTLMGAFFKNKSISWGITNKDMRIHPFWVQDSRTGKGALNKVLKIIVEAIGVSCVIETDITDISSALIGTYNHDNHKFNQDHGLSRIVPLIPKKGGKGAWEYKEPIERGDLGTYDIVIIDEGKIFFQSQNEKTLTVLQPALDFPGHVRKKMRGTTVIEYDCDATLVTTTIPFDQMKRSIIDQGFFQRSLLFIRRLSASQIHQMRKEARKLKNPEHRQKFKTLLVQFKEKISKLNRDEEIIFVDDKAVGVLNKFSDELFSTVQQRIVGPEAISILSFSQTFEDFSLKIAGHIALIEGRKIVTDKDIERTFYIAKNFFDTIINEIEVGIEKEEKEKYEKYFEFIKKVIVVGKAPIKLSDSVELVRKNFNVSASTARKKIEQLKDMNYIKFDDGNKFNTKYVNI